MSSYPLIIWIALSVIWFIVFLYTVDRIQKSKSSQTAEMEKRIRFLEEENRRLKEQEKDEV
ncbi:hypothetical protein BBI11_08875 [Planococcus maritimus]|uniref:hypothetical protein n=1 Tax=Planococcus maritimus TaxID=192421 RepID=UPI00080F1D7A|nr:hypothetical protein [Planococcus maritimus]ANU17125.1 hypothetical protein BBI11_08875 [Planococcus maritimus]